MCAKICVIMNMNNSALDSIEDVCEHCDEGIPELRGVHTAEVLDYQADRPGDACEVGQE